MTGLLVSVRNAEEARQALLGGADLIDVKEPKLGSLGRATDEQIREVTQCVAARVPVSAALGELVDFGRMRPLPPGLRYVKLGLSGCRHDATWIRRWRMAIDPLRTVASVVAVIYVDSAASAPSAQRVLEAGVELGCEVVLLDTFDKQSGDLLRHRSLEQIVAILRQARRFGLLSVLAGSLGKDSIERLLPLAPDYVAVRGAVCCGSRTDSVDVSLVAELAKLVRGGRPLGTPPDRKGFVPSPS